jgi:hypothetical protein
MLEISSSGFDIKHRATSARFSGLVGRRIGRSVNASDLKIRRLIDAADEAGIHPCKLVEWTFNKMDKGECLNLFGIPYPPVEYIYSKYNLTHACMVLVETTSGCTGRMSFLVSKVTSSEYLSKKITPDNLLTAIISKTLNEHWVQTVNMTPEHPLNGRVSPMVEMYEIGFDDRINDKEAEYLWGCIKEL